MGQFLRFALLLILALVGFGSGLCGAFGLGATLIDHSSGKDEYAEAVVVVSLVGLVVAVGCFFAVRALARSLRTHAATLARAGPDAAVFPGATIDGAAADATPPGSVASGPGSNDTPPIPPPGGTPPA